MFIGKQAKNPNAAKLWARLHPVAARPEADRQRRRALLDPQTTSMPNTAALSLTQAARRQHEADSGQRRDRDVPRLRRSGWTSSPQWKAAVAAATASKCRRRAADARFAGASHCRVRHWRPHDPRSRRRRCSRRCRCIFYQSFLTAPVLRRAQDCGRRRLRVHLRRTRISGRRSRNSRADRRPAMTLIAVPLGAHARLRDGAHRPARQALDRAADPRCRASSRRWCSASASSSPPGPVGFYTVWATGAVRRRALERLFAAGDRASSPASRTCRNVYVYASAALKSLGSDVEEAARIAGASPFQRRARRSACR